MRPSQTDCHHLLMGFAISNKLRSAHGATVTSRFELSTNTSSGLCKDAIFSASAAPW